MQTNKHPKIHGSALRAGVAFLALLAQSALAGMPIGQTGTPGTDPYDDVFRIINTDGSAGTGTLIGETFDSASGNISMCFLTADHVVRGSSLGNIGFRSINTSAGTMDPNAFNFSPDQSTTFLGGPGNVVDIALIGATINISKLTTLQSLLLQSDHPLQLAVAPAAAGFNFTLNGYGRSGRPDAAQAGFAYVYHSAVNDEQFGTQRYVNNTVKNYLNYNDGFYNFAAENWFLRDAAGGAIAGEGQGNRGDSGSAVLSNGKIVGVFADLWGDNARNIYTSVSGNEGFKIGSEGLAVKMTQAYSDWITMNCNLYLGVPEPGSVALSCVGGTVFLVAAWRRRRAASRPTQVSQPARDN